MRSFIAASSIAKLRCARGFKYATRASRMPAFPANDRPGSSRIFCLRLPRHADSP